MRHAQTVAEPLHSHAAWRASVLVVAMFGPLNGAAQNTVDVRVEGHRFQPSAISILAGDTVRWVNHEKRTSHSVLFPATQGGESDRFFPGESWQKRFDTPGQFAYRCGPHPEMTGTVNVAARAATESARSPPPEGTFSTQAWSVPRGNAAALLMTVTKEPPALQVFNAQAQLIRSLPLADASGERASGTLPVVAIAPRTSFVVALTGVAEMWEVSVDPHAPEIGLGLVHDFQYREGHFVPGYLNPRRTALACPALAMAVSPGGDEVLTLHSCAPKTMPHAVAMLQVTHLDVRKPTAQIGLRCVPTVPISFGWQDVAALTSAAERLNASGSACTLP